MNAAIMPPDHGGLARQETDQVKTTDPTQDLLRKQAAQAAQDQAEREARQAPPKHAIEQAAKSAAKPTKPTPEPKEPKQPKLGQPCGCGCGEITKPGSRFLPGHDAKLASRLLAEARALEPAVECGCGCGREVRRGSRYVPGHDAKHHAAIARRATEATIVDWVNDQTAKFGAADIAKAVNKAPSKPSVGIALLERELARRVAAEAKAKEPVKAETPKHQNDRKPTKRTTQPVAAAA